MEAKTECTKSGGDCGKAADCHKEDCGGKAADCGNTGDCHPHDHHGAHHGHPALSPAEVCSLRQQFCRSEVQGAAAAFSCPCPNAVAEHVARFHTEHSSFRAGNNPVAIGLTAITASYAMYKGLGAHFDFHSEEASIHSLGGSRYLLQTHATVTVNRANGTKKVIDFGFADVFDVIGCPMSGFKLASLRVYVDVSPALAANGLVVDSDADGNVSIHPK